MVKRCAGGARTGHGGTLDPLATGVLVMAIGNATRLLGQVIGADKRYITHVDLSAFTSTDDREGKPEPVGCPPPSPESLTQALQQLTGATLQPPPAYSAVKVGGRRSYQLARQGKLLAHEPRAVVTHSIVLLTYSWPIAEIAIHCGKGFYVRSFARMLGQALRTGGHCAAIRRTTVGPFSLEHSTPLNRLPERLTPDQLLDVHRVLTLVQGHRMQVPAVTSHPAR